MQLQATYKRRTRSTSIPPLSLHLYSTSIAPPLFSLGTGKGGRERGEREEEEEAHLY